MSYLYQAQRPYQRAGSRFLAKAGSGILADEPGLGKTIQAIGSILADHAHRYGPEDIYRSWHLVAAPSVAVKNVWEPELRRWLRDHKIEIVTLTGKIKDRRHKMATYTPQPDTRHVFVVTNIESLRVAPVDEFRVKTDEDGRPVKDKNGKPVMVRNVAASRRNVIRFTGTHGPKKEKIRRVFAHENAAIPELLERAWDTVIVDESQRALVRSNNKIPTQTRAGFVMVGTEARRRIALSGTPMRGKPEQLWGTLNWLYPDLYRNYWKWVEQFFVVDKTQGWTIVGFKPGGEHRLGKEVQRFMLRRTKAEVAPELPPKVYAGYSLEEGDDESPHGVWLEMSPAQREQMALLEEEGLIGDQIVDYPIVEYTRRRQIATAYHEIEEIREFGSDEPVKVVMTPTLDSPKYDWLVQWLEANEGEKIVVMSQFTSVLEVFAAGLREQGYSVALLTGNVGQSKRTKAIQGFQDGDTRVFMVNTRAGGVALTLDSADYMVFLDETSIPDDQIQGEDRIHRISRNHRVVIYYLRMLETIEEEVAYVAAARYDVQSYLLDGARGVEYARQLYLMKRNKKEAQE